MKFASVELRKIPREELHGLTPVVQLKGRHRIEIQTTIHDVDSRLEGTYYIIEAGIWTSERNMQRISGDMMVAKFQHFCYICAKGSLTRREIFVPLGESREG
jgi:hypothetical protein